MFIKYSVWVTNVLLFKKLPTKYIIRKGHGYWRLDSNIFLYTFLSVHPYITEKCIINITCIKYIFQYTCQNIIQKFYENKSIIHYYLLLKKERIYTCSECPTFYIYVYTHNTELKKRHINSPPSLIPVFIMQYVVDPIYNTPSYSFLCYSFIISKKYC